MEADQGSLSAFSIYNEWRYDRLMQVILIRTSVITTN